MQQRFGRFAAHSRLPAPAAPPAGTRALEIGPISAKIIALTVHFGVDSLRYGDTVAVMKLTWQTHVDPIFGSGKILIGLPEGSMACARRSGCGRYVADAFIGGRYLNHKAGTLAAAIKRINSEIDRRSIGLLGVDDVEFDHA